MAVRGSALAVALVMLAACAPVFASPSPHSFSTLPHAAIRIASDADFTAANGVVAGSGTPLDPFLIAGWHVEVPSGAAIAITNTTKAWVVKENVLEAPTGVSVTAESSWAVVASNEIHVRNVGVFVKDASPAVQDNTLILSNSPFGTTQAIVALQSNAQITGNAVDGVSHAIVADQGSMSVCANDVHRADVGIWVHASSNATVCANVVTDCLQVGIDVILTVGTVISNNTVSTCPAGIESWNNKDVNITANLVVRAAVHGIKFESTSGTVELNTVVDGWANGVEMWHSPLLFFRNNVSNNLAAGFYSENGGATLRENFASRNGVGILLSNNDVLHLEGNVLENNTVGLDVPYSSRQSIPWMQGNLVNGVSVDGSIRADEQVFFYRAANVSIVGGVRDSGFSQGYYGSISAEGNVVLYEVDTATIDGTLIGHASVGVMAVNSFNVVVQNARIVQARVGVEAYGTAATSTGGEYGIVGEVPACVVSVKGTNVTIPVDPAGTVGIEAEDCRVLVSGSAISLVDVGVSAEGSSSLTLANTTITDTRLAVDAQTAPGELNLTGNVVAHNRQGVLQRGGSGAYVDNRVRDNAGAGLVLASGAHARLLGNAFGANGRGVVDAQPCGAPYSCGSVDAEGNAFSGNLGDGVAVNGTTTWRGDSFTANRGTGARLGSATLRDVVASGNDADGVEVRGMFTVRGSTFDHNGRHGATLVGGGDLRGSAFVFNVEAGIRLTSTQVTAYDLNVSRNFDGVLFDEPSAFSPFPVPPLPPASVQDVWALVGSVDPASPGPLDIHHSVLVGNERDAIRAGTAPVNATSNYWGSGTGPALSVADQLGAFRNGVGPTVRFVPWYEDAGLTTTGPVPVL